MDSSESLIKTIFENKGYQTDSEYQRIRNLFWGKTDTVKQIMKRIDELNDRIEVG
jgi:hypothetical protein